MPPITTGNAEQYADSRKLAARARLASRYTIAETPWFEWVAQHLPLRAGDHVLDIGCGPGWFWASATDLMPERLDLTLSDLSAGMVEEAIARCETQPFASVAGEAADAAALPHPDGSFDAVIAMHMLYHLERPEDAIAEAWRVLNPGGFLAVTTNGIGNMRELYRLTTALGGQPFDPAAKAFGFETAESLMRARFGNLAAAHHPARLRVTDPEDIILAMTSFPPGEYASAAERDAFREDVMQAFVRGGGALETEKETALFISRKAT